MQHTNNTHSGGLTIQPCTHRRLLGNIGHTPAVAALRVCCCLLLNPPLGAVTGSGGVPSRASWAPTHAVQLLMQVRCPARVSPLQRVRGLCSRLRPACELAHCCCVYCVSVPPQPAGAPCAEGARRGRAAQLNPFGSRARVCVTRPCCAPCVDITTVATSIRVGCRVPQTQRTCHVPLFPQRPNHRQPLPPPRRRPLRSSR
jgi:hypothetical protein